MSAITPLSALPAAGSTPVGTVTISNTKGRLTAALTSGGTATLDLITKTEGGNWAYVPGGQLVLSSLANKGDEVATLTFNNAASATQYHVVANGGSAACSAWLSGLVDPATSTALVAHASTHLSGAADDLLGSPGNVGDVTPGVFCGTFGADSTHQNSVPSVNGDTFVLAGATQTLTAKTLTAPVINGLTSASGNINFSGSTGTFATSTGAVTIGGGAAAISATSSAAAITLTAGAASTWSTTAGALNLSGFAGINLRLNGAVLADVGATSATKLTVAAGISYSGAAGAGGLDFGNMTGDSALPTGVLSWTGAANKNLSLVGSGTGTVDIRNASTMTIGSSGTTSITLGRTGQALALNSNLTLGGSFAATASALSIADPGNGGAIPVTVSGVCNLTSAGAETRTLAIPTFIGQELTINCDTYIGNIVITSAQAINQAGNTVMTFGAARDCIVLKAVTVGGSRRWVVVANDGVALS